jgi:hypothetical protein
MLGRRTRQPNRSFAGPNSLHFFQRTLSGQIKLIIKRSTVCGDPQHERHQERAIDAMEHKRRQGKLCDRILPMNSGQWELSNRGSQFEELPLVRFTTICF